jgi:hypothetical protein
MAFFADDFHPKGTFALDTGHDANSQPVVLQRDALLDMRLDKPCRFETEWVLGQVSFRRMNRRECFADADTSLVLDLYDLVETAHTGKDGRAHHARREARTFLVHRL